MTGLSIGEVAKRAGVRTSALRYYEQVGLLPPQLRSHGTHGQRRYDPGVLNTLALIAFAKHAGFTIAETRQLLSGFDKTVSAPERWRQVAQRKEQELDALIARATEMKRALQAVQRCQCGTLAQCGQRFRRVAPVHLTAK
jgi:MerR family transcriptional regulator, redox-sensitive transcriptional activator SoxR